MKEEGKLGIVVGEEVDNKDDPYINMSCRSIKEVYFLKIHTASFFKENRKSQCSKKV